MLVLHLVFLEQLGHVLGDRVIVARNGDERNLLPFLRRLLGVVGRCLIAFFRHDQVPTVGPGDPDYSKLSSEERSWNRCPHARQVTK